jgi:hypothetical protein
MLHALEGSLSGLQVVGGNAEAEFE